MFSCYYKLNLGNELDIRRRQETVLPEAREVSGRPSHPQLHLVNKLQSVAVSGFSNIIFYNFFITYRLFINILLFDGLQI